MQKVKNLPSNDVRKVLKRVRRSMVKAAEKEKQQFNNQKPKL